MKIYRGRLDKARLLSLPQSERRLFISLAHLQNEISFLNRAALWSSPDFSSENDAEIQGQLSLSMFFMKILAGKLKEGWQLLQRDFFAAKVSRDFEARATPDSRAALKELKQYFGRGNLLDIVRSNFAFHYSPADLELELESTPDELDLYLEQETNFNSLFYFAEVLANRAVLKRVRLGDGVGLGDDATAMSRLQAELLTVAKLFIQFNQAFMLDFLERYAPSVWKGVAEEVGFERLPAFSEIRFPWFTDTSGGLR